MSINLVRLSPRGLNPAWSKLFLLPFIGGLRAREPRGTERRTTGTLFPTNWSHGTPGWELPWHNSSFALAGGPRRPPDWSIMRSGDRDMPYLGHPWR